MYGNRTYRDSFGREPPGFGGGSAGAPPRDLLVLLGVLFVTFSLQFFASTAALLAPLRLGREVWQSGYLWQVATYPFIGVPSFPLFFLLELLILFWFGRDVYRYLGRRQFWQLLAWGVGCAAAVAIGTQILIDLVAPEAALLTVPFVLMQGQHILLAILVAAFATVYGHATILLMFVLPLKARWFLWLEILFAFMGFLTTKDFAGFLGIVAAVGLTYSMLSGGGLRRQLRELRLRLERRILEARMARGRRQRGFRVVQGDGKRDDKRDDKGKGNGDVQRGPWVH